MPFDRIEDHARRNEWSLVACSNNFPIHRSLGRTTSVCLALPLELLLLHGTSEGVRLDTAVGTPSTRDRSMTDDWWPAARHSGAQHMPGDGERKVKRYQHYSPDSRLPNPQVGMFLHGRGFIVQSSSR